MPSQSPFRLSGIALLIGNALVFISALLSFFIPGPLGPSGPPAVWLAWVAAVGGVLTLIGLPAVYRALGKGAGLLGLLGVIVLFIALLLLEVVSSVIPAIVFASYTAPKTPPTTPPAPPALIIVIFIVGGVLLLLGAILLGIAIFRTRTFPRWIAWALIASGVLTAVSIPLSGPASAIIGTISELLGVLSLFWIGYLLAFQPARAPLAQPGTNQ